MKLFVILLGLTVAQASDKLLITVYYESMCSDSKNFVVNQLVPTVRKLEDYIQLRLIPFGKARSIDNGNSGFECQHGSLECRGNMVQDCALQYMRRWSDSEAVDYVACEMQTLAGTLNNYECVESAGISTADVEECANTNLGIQLQLNSEYFTNMVNLAFVPTVTFNDQFNQEDQDNSQNDLFGTACKYLPEAEPCLY